MSELVWILYAYEYSFQVQRKGCQHLPCQGLLDVTKGPNVSTHLQGRNPPIPRRAAPGYVLSQTVTPSTTHQKCHSYSGK